ncbi:MAG: ACP S-malonyltransferase [Oscillospiraceae bacterium]
MKIAFLYAGQGSQKVSMGKDLYEKYEEFKEIFDLLPENLRQIAFSGSIEELSLTANTQPIMVAFAAGITKLLADKGIKPLMTAGLSLGEYSALNCAGVLDSKTAIEIAAYRGKQMELASEGVASKMAAVLQLDREILKQCCDEASEIGIVQIANYNCPGQIVIAGEHKAVDYACELANEKGARKCVPLQVSGPFHTKFMHSAGNSLEQKFKEIKFSDICIPIVFNCIGREKTKDETIQELLVRQVQNSVYFEDSIRYMMEKGVDTFVEIGPGKTLSGFVKKISTSLKTISIEDVDTLNQGISELEGLAI